MRSTVKSGSQSAASNQIRSSLRLERRVARIAFFRSLLWVAPCVLLVLLPSKIETYTRQYSWSGVVILLYFFLSASVASARMRGWLDAATCSANLERETVARQQLISALYSGKPFALYLRGFSEERRVVLAEPAGSVRIVNLGTESIVSQLHEHTPVYALANYHQTSRTYAQRVFLTPEEWFDKFALYGSRATLLVVELTGSGSGLRRELDWMVETSSLCRTLLVLEQTKHKQLGVKILLFFEQDGSNAIEKASFLMKVGYIFPANGTL